VISMTRSQGRALRAIFRRSVLGINNRGLIPPLVLRAETTNLRAQYRYDALAVEYVQEGVFRPEETIAVPLDALTDFGGRDEAPVVFEDSDARQTVVRWTDRGIPQVREYTVTAPPEFPEQPATFETISAELLDAMAEAREVSIEDSPRYALSCIQMRGRASEIVATDGHQLLIQGGFRFPWEDDLLVCRTRIFASKELPRDRPVEIGKTDGHVFLRVGAWTIALEIQTEGRYPRVDQVIPDSTQAGTHIALDAQDARFLGQTLDRLPGGDEPDAPVTVDCNGQLAIRARAAEGGQSTELLLARSSYSGEPVCFSTNRGFLDRAVRLGFSEIHVSSPEAPLLCRDARRTYAWQPLSKDSALGPADVAVRIESTAAGSVVEPARTEKVSVPLRKTTRKQTRDTSVAAETAKPETTNGAVSCTIASLIDEAVALHAALGEARTQTQRLMIGLRRHRRQSKLVSSTLASLRQLQLQETAG